MTSPKMKRVAFAAALISSAAAIVGCTPLDNDSAPEEASNVVTYHAEYPEYESLGELQQGADVVATVEFTGESRTYELQPIAPEDPTDPVQNPSYGAPEADGATPEAPTIVVTAYQARVIDVLSGNLEPGDLIEVKQLGGEADGVTYVAPDEASLSEQQTALVFLSAWENEPYSLLSPNDALFPQDRSGVYEPLPESDVHVIPEEIATLLSE